jgi:hypothetical protein
MAIGRSFYMCRVVTRKVQICRCHIHFCALSNKNVRAHLFCIAYGWVSNVAHVCSKWFLNKHHLITLLALSLEKRLKRFEILRVEKNYPNRWQKLLPEWSRSGFKIVKLFVFVKDAPDNPIFRRSVQLFPDSH